MVAVEFYTVAISISTDSMGFILLDTKIEIILIKPPLLLDTFTDFQLQAKVMFRHDVCHNNRD
jgi:hypothetical protein